MSKNIMGPDYGFWLPVGGFLALCVLLILFGFWYESAYPCVEWSAERPYTESCGKHCIHTVYRRECLRREPAH